MIEARDFPVGPKPEWELEQPESDQEISLPLKNVADSLLVFHSLKQSRSNWLSSTFPKFSSKSRGGKVSDTIPPPHTIRSLGKFDFQVGPHIFPDTSVYEAHYLNSTPVPQVPRSGSNQPSTSTWQTAPHYRAPTFTPYFPYTTPAAPSVAIPPSVQRAPTPLVSAVASETPITPALINRVNDAASTDPILANFLQLAASGRATSDQLKTLALLIQSLATAPSSSIPASALSSISGSEPHSLLNLLSAQTPSSTPSSSAPATPPASLTYSHPTHEYSIPQSSAPTSSQPPKEFDLVLEFPEKPYDRWLVPRVPVVCERRPSIGNIETILLLVALPFPKPTQEEAESATSTTTDSPQEVVQFRITKVHTAFWDSLLNWAGGSAKVETNRNILEKIAIPERVYLQHRLPEGDLLTKLQAAAVPYSMKLIKPAHGDRVSTRRRATLKRSGSSTESSQGAATTPKRKRPSQSKAGSASKKIACVSCGQGDVPLMMGGRFCRPCVDAGKTGSEAATGPQDVVMTPISTPQPQSEPLSAAAINKRIAGLTAPPLSPSPLGTNPPLVPAESNPDSMSVTPPDPQAAKP
ncbi:hypothetical protein BJV78DRAFT_15495 [Lactifluus subvellereus]|nr:hypothetical protein BJV78DRAFT_15495 [Lactifluus subvellereus]